MTLRTIAISNFRCIEQTDLELDVRTTLIVGPNASGKTSLLEALFFLGRGRSFRTRRLANLIRKGSAEFQAVGRLFEGGLDTVAGVRGSNEGVEARLAGRPVSSIGELARHFAPQVIDPEVHRLLEEGPARRRRFVDWGVFHVEHGFLDVWQRYQRALRQRNAALRQNLSDAAVDLWNADLLAAGTLLTDMRRRYLDRLSEPLREIGAALGLSPELRLEAGWDSEQTFEVALDRARSRDRRLRATQTGPHRADITVMVAGERAKERVSRGQQKLLAAALILAQLRLQEVDHPGCGALLLDDPAAELDRENLRRLLSVVGGVESQVVVTALDPGIQGLPEPCRLFHVKHGRVSRG